MRPRCAMLQPPGGSPAEPRPPFLQRPNVTLAPLRWVCFTFTQSRLCQTAKGYAAHDTPHYHGSAPPAVCAWARGNLNDDGSRHRGQLPLASAVGCEPAPASMAGRGRVFHGVARHHDPEHRRAGDLQGAGRGAAQHEVGAGQLHAEPGRLHSDQRLDGRPVRHPAGVRLGDRPLHPGLVPVRHLRATSTCWSPAASCRAAAAP